MKPIDFSRLSSEAKENSLCTAARVGVEAGRETRPTFYTLPSGQNNSEVPAWKKKKKQPTYLHIDFLYVPRFYSVPLFGILRGLCMDIHTCVGPFLSFSLEMRCRKRDREDDNRKALWSRQRNHQH